MPKQKPAAKKRSAKAKQPVTKNKLQVFFEQPRVRAFLRFGLIWGAAWLVLASSYFSSVIKDQNYLEVFPYEMIFPLLMHALTALLITGVLYRVKRPGLVVSKLILAVLLALFMINYADRLQWVSGLLRTAAPILPAGNEGPAISLIFLVLLFVVFVRLGRWFEHWFVGQKKIESHNLIGGIVVLVLFIFMSQGLPVLQRLPSMQKQSHAVAPGLQKPTAAAAEKPDIYYLVFDRNASDQVLKEQFGYDHSGFTEALKQQGFYVRDGAQSNYPYTAQSIASTLNTTYLQELTKPFAGKNLQSRALYHNLIYQASVIKALKASGYEYHHIGNWYGTSNNAPLADDDPIFEHNVSLFGKEIRRLSGLEAAAFKQSPYYQFAKVSISWWPLTTSEHYGSDMPKEQLDQLNRLVQQKSQKPRFIFAHILLPHDPFYFNADGSLSNTIGNDDVGAPVKKKYLEQVKFVDDQMQQTINTILKNTDGKAVILLNPDEGPHPEVLGKSYIMPPDEPVASVDTNMQDWKPIWLQMKFGIYQAVHIPKATEDDYANLSSVNLFRIVLNRYLGYSLPYLPNCHYGLLKGSQYEHNYTDITEKLTGQPNPACAQYNSIP